MGKIGVVGSYNQDLTMYIKQFPKPKETVKDGLFKMSPGGKGANQADAAAKAGGEVVFIGKIGNDIFGDLAIQHFKNSNINTQFVFRDPDNATGCAVITVDSQGQNEIIVASGANVHISHQDVEQVREILENLGIVLFQFETNLDAIEYSMKIAHDAGVMVCLNPAPMLSPFPKHLFEFIDILVPNEVEAGQLLGYEIVDIESAKLGVRELLSFGLKIAIITMGENGAVFGSDDGIFHLSTTKVKSIDTTGAGDCFVGTFAVALSEKQTLRDAVKFANAAAAINVTRHGASQANPKRKEILEFLENKD